ncbi:hypothetical protein [Caulobacter sp. S45]|uniref:hypothetical protein n=1 Tax=Caulobacter sp. S45 TaxID=1641861 RepID=UPI00131B5258|nr:hypothetical protein [Caulobacter sp. S45]
MAAFGLLLAGGAHAAPEEIQVYMDEMSDPGQFGLDVHNNYVATGDLVHDYPGQQQSLEQYRVTPEFAYGITKNLEFGLYMPLATLDRTGRFGIDGAKLRLKFIAPKNDGQDWFWGANFEIGAVDKKLDINPYNAELKGIIGRRMGPWTVAFNANVDFKVSGPQSAPAELDFDTKISYALTKTFAVGVETYNGAGSFNRFGNFGESDESTFLTIDKSIGHWDINFGVGSGYGSNPDHLIIKAIIGVPIDDPA